MLKSESHPEKQPGPGESADVVYKEYDARGHALRVVDGQHDLRTSYDAAERLDEVRETGSNLLLEKLVYWTTNGTNDWRKGKLQSATRHNHFSLCAQSHNAQVVETYTYGGRMGRVSRRPPRPSTSTSTTSARRGRSALSAATSSTPTIGEEATSSTQDSERLRFTGHEVDFNDQSVMNSQGDDLNYMHARHHSPITGRFLSTDPAGGTAKRPQSWNRYSYVENSPLARVDRDGKFDFAVTGAGIQTQNHPTDGTEIRESAYFLQQRLLRSLTPEVIKFFLEQFGVDLRKLLTPGHGGTVNLALGDRALAGLVGRLVGGEIRLNADLDLFGNGGLLFQSGLIHEAAHLARDQRSFALSLRSGFRIPREPEMDAIRQRRLDSVSRLAVVMADWPSHGVEGHYAEIHQFGDFLRSC